MSEKPTYNELSSEEKAALEYAIVFPHRALKAVLPELFDTLWSTALYRRHNEGREALRRKGLLDKDGNLTDSAYKMMPHEIMAKTLRKLNTELRSEYLRSSTAESRVYELEHKYQNLETKNEKLVQDNERFELIRDVMGTFNFLGVNENWIAILICSNLVEQAMKKKLEQLGLPLEEDRRHSFDQIKLKLGKALKEKEGRALEVLFEPVLLWDIRCKMDHEGYKMRVDRTKADAVFVMAKEIIDQIRCTK